MTEQATVSEDVIKKPVWFRFVGDPAPLFVALAKAKLKFEKIERTKTVKVKPKDENKREYEFSYAPLENMVDATTKALSENELVVLQPYHSVQGGWFVRTILAHSSGCYLEAIDFIASTDRMSNQDFGGILTYRRRYGYGAVLGLVSEGDDDATAAEGNAAVVVPKGASKAPAQQGGGQRGQQQRSSGSRGRSEQSAPQAPVKVTLTPPPNWPGTDATMLCNWIRTVESQAAILKCPVESACVSAWDLLTSDKMLVESVDWPPVLKAFGDEIRSLALNKKIVRSRMGEAFVTALTAEENRIRDEALQQRAESFDDPAPQQEPGTESQNEPADQTN